MATLSTYSPQDMARLRQRLTNFYTKHAPAKLAVIDKALAMTDKTEAQILDRMCKGSDIDPAVEEQEARAAGVFGPAAAAAAVPVAAQPAAAAAPASNNNTDASSAAAAAPTISMYSDAEKDRMRKRLTNFYSKYAPDKLGNVEKAVGMGAKTEALILEKMCQGSGVDPNVEVEEAKAAGVFGPSSSSSVSSPSAPPQQQQQQQQQQLPSLSVKLKVVNCRNLKSQDTFSASDCYIVAECGAGGQKQKTKTVDNNNNPDFNENFSFKIEPPQPQKLVLELWDADVTKDVKFGTVVVPLENEPRGSAIDKVLKWTDSGAGELNVRIMLKEEAPPPPAGAAPASASAAGGGAVSQQAPTPTIGDYDEAEKARFKQRIANFYQKYAPEKAAVAIERALGMVAKTEAAILEKMCSNSSVEPSTEIAEAKAASVFGPKQSLLVSAAQKTGAVSGSFSPPAASKNSLRGPFMIGANNKEFKGWVCQSPIRYGMTDYVVPEAEAAPETRHEDMKEMQVSLQFDKCGSPTLSKYFDSPKRNKSKSPSKR